MPPTPSPVPVLIVGDAWAWSLDSLIAVLGAVATALLAWLALRQTKRANRLDGEARQREEEARERAEQDLARARRSEMRAAVSVYLDTWKPSGQMSYEQSQEAVVALIAAAAAISDEAARVAHWITEAMATADWAGIEYQNRHDSDLQSGEDRHSLLRGALTTARLRVINWVATGTLDQSPVANYLYERDGVEPTDPPR